MLSYETHSCFFHPYIDFAPLFSVLKVTISVSYSRPSDFRLPSPPYYRPASSVTLTCRAHHPTGSVTYRWSSTCSNSNCFARSSSSQSISKTILQSIDAGVHTCRASDGNGNTGRNSTEMILIGKYRQSQTTSMQQSASRCSVGRGKFHLAKNA